MKGPDREERALAGLLRAARVRAGEMRAHLANLEAARASAESSLDWLAQAVRAEEAAAERTSAEPGALARYLEGAGEKQRALQSTRDMLSAEIEPARAALAEAETEIEKLDRLLSVSRRIRSAGPGSSAAGRPTRRRRAGA